METFKSGSEGGLRKSALNGNSPLSYPTIPTLQIRRFTKARPGRTWILISPPFTIWRGVIILR